MRTPVLGLNRPTFARSYQLPAENGSMSKLFCSESVDVAVRLSTGDYTSSHLLSRNEEDWK